MDLIWYYPGRIVTSTKPLKKSGKLAALFIHSHILLQPKQEIATTILLQKNSIHETLEGSKHLAIKEGRR